MSTGFLSRSQTIIAIPLENVDEGCHFSAILHRSSNVDDAAAAETETKVPRLIEASSHSRPRSHDARCTRLPRGETSVLSPLLPSSITLPPPRGLLFRATTSPPVSREWRLFASRRAGSRHRQASRRRACPLPPNGDDDREARLSSRKRYRVRAFFRTVVKSSTVADAARYAPRRYRL